MNTPPRTRPVANRNGSLDAELKIIRRTLNSLRIPWALSGSMATKLHANSLHVELHRFPNDIDIVIRPSDVDMVTMALAGIGYTSNRPPPLRFVHVKLHHGKFSIDLLAAGSSLAPNILSKNVTLINRTPVVKIRHLITQKNRVLTNNFLSKLTKNTVLGNKKFLENLEKRI